MVKREVIKQFSQVVGVSLFVLGPWAPYEVMKLAGQLECSSKVVPKFLLIVIFAFASCFYGMKLLLVWVKKPVNIKSSAIYINVVASVIPALLFLISVITKTQKNLYGQAPQLSFSVLSIAVAFLCYALVLGYTKALKP